MKDIKSKSKIQKLVIILILVLVIFCYKGYQYWSVLSGNISKKIISEEEFFPRAENGEGEKIISQEKAVSEEKKIIPEGETENQEKTAISSQVYPTENTEKEKQTAGDNIYLSADKSEQGDTLLVQIKGEKAADRIEGELGLKKVDFFKLMNSGDWFAIIGIDAKEEPGEYTLKINFSDIKFQKKVSILKRNFQIGRASCRERV